MTILRGWGVPVMLVSVLSFRKVTQRTTEAVYWLSGPNLASPAMYARRLLYAVQTHEEDRIAEKEFEF